MNLDDRMKLYEEISSVLPKLFPLLPAHARLDGKNFSKFTRGLAKPYDVRLSQLMVTVTTKLVEHFNARIGYTQSDEISLLWYSDKIESQIPHDGRRDKLNTDLATYCCNTFNRHLPDFIPEKEKYSSAPQFDCRLWNTPTMLEAANAFSWVSGCYRRVYCDNIRV
ncbi:MAG: tRNA(His) guanylyltransferase Thg1 family protein [Magnetococcales bacterium]|nr:tRNA(His) guanylyltransferase Thg1 family protein [Magnetococcales bacterium]